MSYAVNLTFRVVFNIHARDVTNSFRLYRTAILKPMRLESNDFDILEEILIKAVTRRPPARIVRSARDLWPAQGGREQAQAACNSRLGISQRCASCASSRGPRGREMESQ